MDAMIGSTRKRDRLEVIFDILRIIQANHNSILPTPLLRKSNLSTARFAEYYQELVMKGFVKEIIDNKNRSYITLTDLGFRYVEKYTLILGFIKEFEL